MGWHVDNGKHVHDWQQVHQCLECKHISDVLNKTICPQCGCCLDHVIMIARLTAPHVPWYQAILGVVKREWEIKQ